LATQCFGQCSAVHRGRVGASAALRLKATQQVLVFVVAGPGDLRGTRRFVTTHWPCTAECVHYKTPSTSPRPRGRPLLQRLLQGYAILTEPGDGPASGAINMQLNCARSLSAFGGAQQWNTREASSLGTFDRGTMCLSSCHYTSTHLSQVGPLQNISNS
jgi:hypothetical protein